MTKIKNIPEKIYLQIDDEADDEDFNNLYGVSWCADKINENDIEFVRKDDPATPESTANWQKVGDQDKWLDEVRGRESGEEKIKQRILTAYYAGFNQAHYSHVHPESFEVKECQSAGEEYLLKNEKWIDADLKEYASLVNEWKVEFYRNETSKIRKYVFDNNIGRPSQSIFDAIIQEVERLNILVNERKDVLSELHFINVKRCPEFGHSVMDWSAMEWAVCVAGEVGEMCNFIKKKHRGDHISVDDISKEAADIVIYLDLLSTRLGFSLKKAIVEKFNEVSDRISSDVKFQ